MPRFVKPDVRYRSEALKKIVRRTETKIVTSTLMMEAAGYSATLVATERLNVVINQDDSLKFSPAWKPYVSKFHVCLRCKTELQEFIINIIIIMSLEVHYAEETFHVIAQSV